VLGLCLLLSVISGCTTRSEVGEKVMYTFAGWVGASVILGGLLLVPLGWALRRVTRYGVIAMIMSPILLIIVAPAMYSDHVIIDNEHFEARYGFWFNPRQFNLRFAELREIRYVGVPGSRGRINYQLECRDQQGQTHVVSAGDLVRHAVAEVMARAAARGVPVVNQAP